MEYPACSGSTPGFQILLDWRFLLPKLSSVVVIFVEFPTYFSHLHANTSITGTNLDTSNFWQLPHQKLVTTFCIGQWYNLDALIGAWWFNSQWKHVYCDLWYWKKWSNIYLIHLCKICTGFYVRNSLTYYVHVIVVSCLCNQNMPKSLIPCIQTSS